ncbi:MAG: CHAT domain-containing protein, partial [Planctomycetes bacterium]|nr:CHAT domain-containing protein [Planctomycetota bacterium]
MKVSRGVVSTILTAAAAVATAQPTGPGMPSPLPLETRRVDALDPRAAMWGQLVEKLVSAGAYSEAIKPATDLYEFHLRESGPNHHRTVSARIELQGIEQLAALPSDAQREMARAEQLRLESREAQRANRLTEAQRNLDEATSIVESHLGSDHPQLIAPLSASASIAMASGNAKRAGELFQRAMTIAEQHYGGEHPVYAAAQTYLTSYDLAMGRFTEALERAQEAWAITSRQLGPQHSNSMVALSHLVDAYQALGRYDEAIVSMAQIVTIREQTVGETDTAMARAHASLGQLLSAAGELHQAEPALRKALQIYSSNATAAGLEQARVLDNLGALTLSLGGGDAAADFFKRSYNIRREAVGETDASVVIALRRLARAYLRAGAVDEAELVIQRAALAARNAYGLDHQGSLAPLADLADLCAQQGRYEEATILNRKRLQIATTSLGVKHPSSRAAHSALADVLPHTPMSEADVVRFLEEMRYVREASAGVESEGAAEVLSRLAQYALSVGDVARARESSQKLLALSRTLYGDEAPQVALPLLNLAEVSDRLGNRTVAAELTDRALVVLDGNAESRDPLTIAVLTAGGRYHHLLGHHDKAIELVDRARKILSESASFVDALPSRSDEQLVPSQPYLVAASVMLDAGRGAEALICLDQHWTRGWLETLANAGISPADVLEADQQRAVYVTQARISAIRAQLQRLKRFEQPTEVSERNLAAARNAQKQLQAQVASDSRYASLTSPQPVDLTRLHKQILADGATAIIGWFDRPSLGHDDSDSKRFAFVLRSSAAPVWIPLPDANVGQPDGPTPTADADDSQTEADDLFRTRFEPLLEHLKGIRRLIVVPTGTAMAQVPVEALPLPRSGDDSAESTFVVDRFEVSYAPSLSAIMEEPWHSARSTEPADTGPMLALIGRASNPAFGRRAGAGTASILNAVDEEATSLAALFPKSRVWRGRDAQERRFWQAVSDQSLGRDRVLHFGTDSYVDSAAPHRSAIALSRPGAVVSFDTLLSAGRFANGWLDLREILSLKLDADVVSLTACRAAGEDDQPGHDSPGATGGLPTSALPLAHAFLLAGARNVVTTLWPVEG